ncbi:Cytochrome P450, E-class, group I [Trema orientale]|uniref:Cytochrome P450, E-class, group I n=1 Tax=Trema orientale TaxID=63057 RepID=A0A2P5F8H7_TREOI|nr:Cytochrome P450, E-class, group I [Trema orientale]
MCLRIGQVPTVVVSSPEYAKEVMRTHDVVFAFRPRVLYLQIMFYNSTSMGSAPYGEYWRRLRKIYREEVLSTKRVQSFRPIREKEMLNLVEWIALNVGSAINLTEKVQTLMYGIIYWAAFGKRSRDHEEFISIVEEAIKISVGFELADLFPSFSFLAHLISRSRPKYERLKRRAARIIENIVKEHKENMSEGKSGESGTEEDLVDVLLKFHNNGELGCSLTSDNLKAIIFEIFAAGGETAATTIDWAMVEMIRNPRVMKKAQDEIRKVFSRKEIVDETGISEMKYLKSVVKETLRLHTPAPLSPRESRENCEINGYEIPAKTMIVTNTWAIGRDPKYWTEPESFIPERFLDSSIEFSGNHFEYIPFGAGRRICPGMSFGLINVQLLLAMLLYHFDWKLPNAMKHEDLDMTELCGVTLKRKDALHLIPTAYDMSPIEKSHGR